MVRKWFIVVTFRRWTYGTGRDCRKLLVDKGSIARSSGRDANYQAKQYHQFTHRVHSVLGKKFEAETENMEEREQARDEMLNLP